MKPYSEKTSSSQWMGHPKTFKDALRASAEPAPTDNDTWNSLLESRARSERELRESHAREAQLRAALDAPPHDQQHVKCVCYGKNPAQVQVGYICNKCKALTLPAPPVVPVEDVKPLVEALTKIVQERFYPMSKRLKTDVQIAQDALSTFAAKHKL